MSREEATQRIVEAKCEKGLTFSQLRHLWEDLSYSLRRISIL
jgi:hypothetical protein